MDDDQLRAIHHLNGPALVIAGPGCGKTSVISNRIRNLVFDNNIKQESIVALSFTRFSSSELKTRTLGQDQKLEGIFYGTIHSFFLKILTFYFHYPNFSVIGNKEKFDTLKIIIANIIKTNYIPDEAIEIISSEISKIKSRVKTEDFLSKFNSNYDNELIYQIYKAYIKWQKDNERLDFDDILIKTYNLLIQSPQIKKKIQRRYSYYIIDEFQDINEIQFNTLKLLLDENQNLFVVGDEDQSIYGFRGASPLFMLYFNANFPSAKVYPIIRSYRCPKCILDVANNLISMNNDRTPKSIEPSKCDYGSLKINKYNDILEQSLRIAKRIKLDDDSINMVIYRTNNEALPFIKIFTDMNINFQIKDKRINFFSHFIVKDIIAYMKASINIDLDLINRIKNKPNRNLNFIRKEDLLNADNPKEFLSYNRIRIIKTNRLINQIRSLNNYDFHKALCIIRNKLGYDKYLIEYCKKNNVDSSSFDEIFNYFNILIKTETSISEGLRTFNFLYKTYVNNFVKLDDSENKINKVLLVTAHGSKGLEADNVYVTSLNERIFPHKKSIENNIEEERRLFYVSITRAKKNLYLSYLCSNKRNKLIRSRFLDELKMQEIK